MFFRHFLLALCSLCLLAGCQKAPEQQRLINAIQDIIGPTPFVLVWDSTPLDELIDDRRTLVSCAAPEHQASYASHGLCLAGAHAFSTRHSEEQP